MDDLIVAQSAVMAEAQTGSQVGVTMLKKTQDAAANQQQQLIESIPDAPNSANLPGQGMKIDLSA